MTNPNQQTHIETNEPYEHQKWMLGHLATRKLGENDRVNLATPEGKPVIVHSLSDPVHGERVDVSRGSLETGDISYSTVSRIQHPDGYMPEMNPPRTAERAQEIINDLRRAS